MRVLDLGCGRGDVSLLLAGMVDAHDEVVGLDRDADALAAARARCGSDPRLHFVQAPLESPPTDLGSFDAIVGRRVLMYLADPATVLRQLAVLLRPGGVMAFQEDDFTLLPGRLGDWALHDRVLGWLRAMILAEGGDPGIGFQLPDLLTEARLALRDVRAEAVIQGRDAHHPLPVIVQAVQSRLVAHGIATAEDIGAHDLEARLARERAGHRGVYVSDMVFCAWGQSA